MGKAEDMVRRRNRAESRRVQKEQDEAKRLKAEDEQRQKEQLYRAIEAEAQAALARLEAKGFPGGELYKFGRWILGQELAGWRILYGHKLNVNNDCEDPKYLTFYSNGQFEDYERKCVGIRDCVYPFTRTKLHIQALQQVLRSLQGLGT